MDNRKTLYGRTSPDHLETLILDNQDIQPGGIIRHELNNYVIDR